MRLRERLIALIESAGRSGWGRSATLAPNRSVRRARLKVALGVIVLVVVVFFFVIRAKATVEDLAAHWQTLNFMNIVWSSLIVLIAFGLAASLWWCIIRILGGSIGGRTALRVYFLSSLPRYIPGSVWGYVGRTYLIEQLGARRTVAVASIVIEVGLFVASGFMVGLWYWMEPWAAGIISTIIILVTIWGLAYAPLLLKSNWSVRTLMLAVAIVVGYLAFWMIYGLSITVLVQDLEPSTRFDGYVGIISGFALSWLAGFLAVLVPGGLGIREAGIVLTLEPMIGGVSAIFVAILSRVINLAMDALLFVVALVIGRPMSNLSLRNDKIGN